MGNTPSRPSGRRADRPPSQGDLAYGGSTTVRPLDGDVGFAAPPAPYAFALLKTDPELLAHLREDIRVDPETFLLDQLLLSVQFFRNYAQEMSEQRRLARRKASDQDLQCGAAARSVLNPDALHQVADRHVRWRCRRHQPDQPLRPQRHFVLQDNVILRDTAHTVPEEQPPVPGAPTYHLAVEAAASGGAGQVRLRRLHVTYCGEDQSPGRLSEGDVEPEGDVETASISPSTAGSLCESCHTRLSRTRTKRKSRASSSSGVSSTSSLASNHRSSKCSSKSSSKGSSKGSSISSSKGSSRSSSRSSSKGSSRSSKWQSQVALEDFRLGVVPQDLAAIPEACFRPLALEGGRLCLSASTFMASFGDVFSESLAGQMGLLYEDVVEAVVRRASILCEKLTAEGGVDLHEVLPAFRLPGWPRVAAEWVLRSREGPGGEWPPSDAVRWIHELGGVAVPSGPGTTWSLAFPAAERALELSLTASQAHAYLVLLCTHRGALSLEAVDQAEGQAGQGLNADHLRAFMLWQVERAPTGWYQRQAGRRLRDLLAGLYAAIQAETLPDYFVRERNLLDGVPRHLLRRVQERLFRVREKLFASVLDALRNLVYVDKQEFFPVLDYQRLVLTLTGDGELSEPKTERETDERDAPTSWKAAFQRELEEEKAAKELQERIANSSTATNVQTKLGHHNEITIQRTKDVLILFASHFIRMGMCSINFGALQQAWVYLEQSLHLAIILKEDYNGSTFATEIFNNILQAEIYLTQSLQVGKPSTNQRIQNSGQLSSSQRHSKYVPKTQSTSQSSQIQIKL